MSFNFKRLSLIDTGANPCLSAIPLMVCWLKDLRPVVSRWTQANGWNALRVGLSKGHQPVFTRISEKTTENSKRLGRQSRSGIELSTSHPSVLESRTAQPLVGLRTDNVTSTSYPGFKPGTFDVAAGFLTSVPLGRSQNSQFLVHAV